MGVGMYGLAKGSGKMPKAQTPIKTMPAGAVMPKTTLGQRLFLSENFGVTSPYIGNKVTLMPVSKMNVPQRFIKAGWSTRTVKGGGMQIRIGIGTSSSNANIARWHGYVPGTFVPNNFANPSIQVKISLFKLNSK